MRSVIVIAALSLLVMSGCVSVPKSLDQPLTEPAPLLSQAQHSADQVKGAVVRWGGTIIKVQNVRDASWVEVVARPLDSSSRPNEKGASPGRFMIVTPHFLDPEVYQAGRAITVTGRLEGVKVKKVGEYEYRYPLLQADGYHLWAPPVERRANTYDPFWDYPWHPYWGYHPYYRPYYYW